MALCRFFRPVSTQPKRKRLRLMYQSDKELECILIAPEEVDPVQEDVSGQEEGDEVVMKAVTRSVSLNDPFTLRLIESPVRGRDCDHVQAFDRSAFLDFNELMERNRWCKLTKKWKCPFCGRHIRSANDLVQATDLQEMLDEVKLTQSDVTYAVLHPDGHLSLPSSSQPNLSQPVAAVDTSSDEEPSQPQVCESPAGNSSQADTETPPTARQDAAVSVRRSPKKVARKATSKKEKKAALAAAKAAWVERQNEKQGSILSYCQKQMS